MRVATPSLWLKKRKYAVYHSAISPRATPKARSILVGFAGLPKPAEISSGQGLLSYYIRIQVFTMLLIEWLPLATVCLLGAMSPGPSLAVVLSQTLRGGQKSGYATAVSHGVGVSLYGLITVAGLAALVTGSPLLFSSLQLAGAVYLIYLGIKSLRVESSYLESHDSKSTSGRSALLDGFLVAFLNPKLAVFMLALFSQFLSVDTDWQQRWTMVATVGSLDALWYSAVVMFVSRPPVLARLRRASVVIERVLGATLIVIALTVIGATVL